MAIQSTSTKIDWLYPELLSKEGLIEILSQRFVKLPDDTSNTSREDLLDLYYEFVIPRPQRKYRQNRRGRDMARKQILDNKKRKITGPSSSEPPSKKTPAEPSRLLTSFEGVTAGDRLKPPPSCVNFEKRVIKLGGFKTPSDSHNMKTSPTVGPNSTSTYSPVSATPRVIKLNRSSSGDSKSPTDVPQTVTLNKTIKLINSHIGGTSGDSSKKSHNGDRMEESMETDNPEPSPEKKVKIQKISWP